MEGLHVVPVVLEDPGVQLDALLDVAVVLLCDRSAVEAGVSEGVAEVGGQLFEGVASGGEDVGSAELGA